MTGTCKHPRQEFLGTQDFGPDFPLLDLFNCLDRRSTVSRPHKKENDNKMSIREITITLPCGHPHPTGVNEYGHWTLGRYSCDVCGAEYENDAQYGMQDRK